METVTLPTVLVNQLLIYLSERPYKDVHLLIHAIHEAAKRKDDDSRNNG